MQLPAGATNVHLNSKLGPLLLDCSVQDIPSMYMGLPDQPPPTDVRLIPELGGVHYSNRNPAPNVAGGNPPPIVQVHTRQWALSPSESRHRISVFFQWPGAVQESCFTTRDISV